MMYFIGLAIFMLIITLIWERKLLKLNPNVVSMFVIFMFIVTLFRWGVLSGLHYLGLPVHNQGLSQVPYFMFMFVGWEDLAFGLPIYWLKDKFKLSKYIWMPIVAAMSIFFAMGHTYQVMEVGQYEISWVGWLAALLPYYIFYRLGKKFGFSTTIICHMVYDMMTFLCLKLFPIVVV